MTTKRKPISRSVQAKVLATYGTSCWLRFDGCAGSAETLDHIMPYSKGGSDTVRNLLPACRHCNSMRADRLVQGRGIDVHVIITIPHAKPRPRKGRVLDFTAMLDLTTSGGQLDEDGYEIAVAAWRGACNKALRIVSSRRLTLLPPPPVAVASWREWLRLGYDVRIEDGTDNRPFAGDMETRDYITLLRSGLTQRRIDELAGRRDDDWRRYGLLF